MKKHFLAHLSIGLFLSIFLALTVFHSGPLRADDQTQPLKIQHEIVVTATRLETPVKETASAISLVRIENLSPAATIRPEIIFMGVPGVFFLQPGLAGGTGSLFIRGANSEHAVFMIDGLELNDPISPSRSFNFNLFDLSLIDRVEVLRGPQSTLYGSDALAGVVNLITAEPDKNETAISGLYGSHRTGLGNLRIARVKNNLSFVVETNSFSTTGISSASSYYPGNNENDGFHQQSLALKLAYRLSPEFKITWQSRGLYNRAELDAFGGPYGDDPNSMQKTRFIFNRLELNGFLWNHRWEQKLVFGFEAGRRDYDNPADESHPSEAENAIYKSHMFKIDWQNNFYLSANNTLVLGADFREERGSSFYVYSSLWGDFESSFPQKSASLIGLYIQDQWKLWNRLSLTAGLRSDHHQRFGQAVTLRTAACLDLPGIQARVKATVGSGFKAPSLYQLYAPESMFGPIGNENLRPERNTGWDAGVEKEIGERFSVSFSYFEMRYRNLIQFYYGSGYQNVGRASSRGLETSLQANLLNSLALRASWTHLRARDLDSGTPLLRRPENSLHLDLSYTRGSLNLAVELNYIGSRLDVNYSAYPAETVKLKPAAIANLLLNYELDKPLSVFLHIQNLLDTRYELIYGYGSPGLTVSTGFKLKL